MNRETKIRILKEIHKREPTEFEIKNFKLKSTWKILESRKPLAE